MTKPKPAPPKPATPEPQQPHQPQGDEAPSPGGDTNGNVAENDEPMDAENSETAPNAS